MMSDFKLPHCPYCGTKLFYTESLVTKSKDIFKCPRCTEKSRVVLEPMMFKFLGLVQIISLVVFASVVFLGSLYCLLGLLIINLVFGVFYIFSPFMVKLKPRIVKEHKDKKAENKQKEITVKEEYKNIEEDIFSN